MLVSLASLAVVHRSMCPTSVHEWITYVAQVSELTASQVNKAGQRIRRHFRGEDVDAERLWTAVDVLVAFRAEHARPLAGANMGLRSAVRSAGLPVQVSQRLKRIPTIVDKLKREPTLPLSRMQDIGGCRAVVPDLGGLREVESRMTNRRSKARELVTVYDYIEHPRSSGYRGVHLVMRYLGRSIEIQLRTPYMHRWALEVERLTDRYGQDYKGGWDETVSPYLALVSEAMAAEETGVPVPETLAQEIERQRILSIEYLGGRQ